MTALLSHVSRVSYGSPTLVAIGTWGTQISGNCWNRIDFYCVGIVRSVIIRCVLWIGTIHYWDLRCWGC